MITYTNILQNCTANCTISVSRVPLRIWGNYFNIENFWISILRSSIFTHYCAAVCWFPLLLPCLQLLTHQRSKCLSLRWIPSSRKSNDQSQTEKCNILYCVSNHWSSNRRSLLVYSPFWFSEFCSRTSHIHGGIYVAYMIPSTTTFSFRHRYKIYNC